MNVLSRFTRWLTAAVLILVAGLASLHAQASCAAAKTGVDTFGEPAVRAFAEKLNAALDRQQVNVALIARSGRPRRELPAGVSYTHVAFAVFEPVAAKDGTVHYTYCVYNLYQGADGKADRSYLAQDFTYDFVAGSRERDIAVIVPVDALQQRILAVIRSPAYRALQNPNYNVVANPERHQSDNCVTHTLRVVMAAIYGTSDDGRIQSDICAYFHPTPVHVGLFTAIGAHFAPGVSFADEGPAGLQTASFDSLRAFFIQNNLAKASFSVTMD